MNEQKPLWANGLKDTPFSRSFFTDELKVAIVAKTIEKPAGRRRNAMLAASMTVLIVIMAGIGLYGSWEKSGAGHSPASRSYEDEEVRSRYSENGKLLMEVFPDPYLAAGSDYGYLFHLTAPFEELKGRTLSITARHIRTGLEITALEPDVITEPSSGYAGLDRLTVSFALPIGGLWRYVLELDGKDYGNVVLDVEEPGWEISPTFQSGAYSMRGTEGKVGIIDAGFIAGKSNKYMWHFWKLGELDGKFEVKAVKQGEDRLIDVFAAEGLGQALNGADRHIPSMMMLPEPGLWRLLPYVDGRLLDSIVVNVS